MSKFRKKLPVDALSLVCVLSLSTMFNTKVVNAATVQENLQQIPSIQTKQKNLTEDTIYYYNILAVNNSLYTPTSFTAKAKSNSKISLDWNSVSGATSYYIYRSTSSSGTYSKIDTVTTSSYTDDNLKSNKTYYYKIKAHN
ncbi:hypothetical protein I6U48_19655, partial [Clostridium sp. PL3]|nr:hypothetical protein [Clostridium thailandense]